MHRKLFGHPESGHAFKVRLCLSVADIAHEYEVVDIFAARDQRSAEFQQYARFGEVPVLVENGQFYTQSNAILVHLAQQTGLWGGENRNSLNACTQWLMWEANRIGMCLPQLRARQKFETNPALEAASAWLLSRYEHDIKVLEETLQNGREWILAGNTPTIADFSLCGYLFFADEAKLSVPPHVQTWLNRVASLERWQHPYSLLA